MAEDITTDELHKEFQSLRMELEKNQRKLLTLSQYLTSILKHIHEGILYLANDGAILSINDAAIHILHVDPKELLYKRFWNHFRDDFFGFSLKDALYFGLSQPVSFITLNHKEKKEIEVTTTYIQEGQGPYQGILLVLREITEIQRVQLLLLRRDRMKELGEMVATVAHEIKNPLGGMRGYATLLQRELEHHPELHEMAGYIIEGTKILDRLVNRVLHYARPIQIQPVSSDLVAIVRNVVKFMKVDPSFPPNISIKTHIPEEPLLAAVDVEALQSALINLFINALQAMPNGGTITVSLIKQDKDGVITLSDTGVGIEEKDLPRLFTPFFTTKNKGNGLGLAETFKIIQAHHGKIDVRSLVGRGTTFTITLPLKR